MSEAYALDAPLRLEQAGPQGMIALRGDLGTEALAAALRAVVGIGVPERLRAVREGERAALWMSPDELLLWLPPDRVPEALARLEEELSGSHFLAADVSDARAVFTVHGADLAAALARLTPADLRPESFAPGTVRRTRLAQVPAALWRNAPDRATVLVFRSVADYAERLLSGAVASANAPWRDGGGR
jgi:sarcosine oxidase subunit gamma